MDFLIKNLSMISLIFHVIFPICLCFYFLRKRYFIFQKWFFNFVVVLACAAYLFIVAPWGSNVSYFLRYVVMIVVVFFSVKSLNKNALLIRSFSLKKFKVFSTSTLIFLLCFSFFSFHFCSALKGYIKPNESLDVDFPLKEKVFYILHGGGSYVINYHNKVKSQKYALDIAALNALGSRTKTLIPKELSDFNIYLTPVYSPCDGIVAKIVDGHPDQELGQSDVDHPAGNYILIDRDDQYAILLAHLKRGSLKVREGDSVRRGDLLAVVGNSGNTSEPHLHLHGVKKGDDDFLFNGCESIALTFKGKFLHRNHLVFGEKGGLRRADLATEGAP